MQDGASLFSARRENESVFAAIQRYIGAAVLCSNVSGRYLYMIAIAVFGAAALPAALSAVKSDRDSRWLCDGGVLLPAADR